MIEKMAQGKKKAVRVRFYRMRNALKEKAGGLGAKGGGSLPSEKLMAAQAEFDKMAEDYPDWVQGHLDKLYEQLRLAADESKRKHAFEEISLIAHDMKGQGGTFGYPLISHFADSLYTFTGPNAGFSDNHVEIVKAHIDSMQVIIKDRVSGDGGLVGEELIQGLEKAIEKYSAGH